MAENTQANDRVRGDINVLFKISRFVFYACCLLSYLLPTDTRLARAEDFSVSSKQEIDAALKRARPGDTLILADGEYRDLQIVFRGKGTVKKPIALRAATPGKVVCTGKSSLRIGGENLIVEGLSFENLDDAISDPIQFRIDSDEPAQHCRMTNCRVSRTEPSDSANKSRWVGLYGSDNRVDHCDFYGKTSAGTTFVVWLGKGGEGRHLIDHNYFGSREPLGKNGGETIRIGDSQTSMLDGNCVVEDNLFEKCNGEAECISNKSCKNIYRGNTFLEVSGTLTLRHGNACLVENNVFVGNEARGTGGVRIIGEDHIVRGNYMENLTGDDGRAAISIMMGIPNSPPHRYFQVKNALVENNTIVDCKYPLIIGLQDDDESAILPPTATTIRGNAIVSPKRSIVDARCPLDGITWEQNTFFGKALGIPENAGISTAKLEVARRSPISRQEVGTQW